jgi:hypothetical protein
VYRYNESAVNEELIKEPTQQQHNSNTTATTTAPEV